MDQPEHSPRGAVERAEFEDLRRRLLELAKRDWSSWIDSDPELSRALDRLTERSADGDGRAGRTPSEAPASGGHVLVVAKVDRFDVLKARVGADIADGLLAALRERIFSRLRDVKIGRVGRGLIEFVFAPVVVDAIEPELLQLHEALEQPVVVDGEAFSSPIILGVTRLADAAPVPEAVRQAERALGRAELAGAKLHVFCEKERADASERLALMRDLRAAISGDQLSIAYQPKLNVRTGGIDSAEALVRWSHPVRGVVGPDQFIEMAEDTGDIGRITETVLTLVLRDLAALARDDLTVYVNLSGRLLTDDGFCDWLLKACSGAPGRIGVEITETAVIADPDRALRNLRALAEAGIRIAIDDYGAGLSSLAYLKALPANELKIDKSFVLGLSSSHRDPLIVRSTIDLAHALGMEVTAEGVDDATALALLRVMGCDRVQGYLIAKPLALEALSAFLERHGSEGSAAHLEPTHPLLSLRR